MVAGIVADFIPDILGSLGIKFLGERAPGV
jgi:hypothetical protein